MTPKEWVLALVQEPSVLRAVQLAFKGSERKGDLVVREDASAAAPVIKIRKSPTLAFVEVGLLSDVEATVGTLLEAGMRGEDLVAVVTDLRGDLVERCRSGGFGVILPVGPSPIAFVEELQREIATRSEGL